MKKLFIAIVFAWLTLSSVSYADGNFVPIRLPKGIYTEIPKNWTILTNNQRITLDTFVQSKLESNGVLDVTHDLNFAANYYDDYGKTAAVFNIRYYPDLTLTQNDAMSASSTETKELDDALKNEMIPSMQKMGMSVLAWLGTQKQSINGMTAFVTEYRRAAIKNDGSPVRVRLVRVFNVDKSFTITISYHEDQEFILRPICNMIIKSIHM